MSKPSWARVRSVASVAVAGVVSFTVVGAGIAYASSSHNARPSEVVTELSIGSIPTIHSGADIALPIDEYWVPAADQNLILRAEHVAMTSCMARFGLDWDVPVQEVTAKGPSHDRLFGVTDLNEVKLYGYHAPSNGKLDADGTISDRVKSANTVLLSEEQDAVASGQTELTSVNGIRIPSGGCVTEARSQVGTQTDLVLQLTEATIGYGAMQADKDPRVLKAFDEWSGCMARAGYNYSTPWEANDYPSWATPKATPEEIAVAIADVECQRESSLTGLRVAVAAAWQEEYMRDHRESFLAMKKLVEQQRANAISILTADGVNLAFEQ